MAGNGDLLPLPAGDRVPAALRAIPDAIARRSDGLLRRERGLEVVHAVERLRIRDAGAAAMGREAVEDAAAEPVELFGGVVGVAVDAHRRTELAGVGLEGRELGVRAPGDVLEVVHLLRLP